ncbi:hypothetical protein [Capnocytophaga canimorsus]|uniref:hypothetical protein n=1 Tax=Capnocytophaga canimorsus TaxID=28188 RepID=UPI001EDD7100|nr:hypothetical protein [Capnocytophaga canimorsus]GJQ03616.1 hypothetical protein CAPN009_00310 [Capnocytophaga canimorsus]
MEILERQTLTIKDLNGNPKKEFGTFIPDCRFGEHTHLKALKYSLLVLDAIDTATRLNLFLEAMDKTAEQVSTEIFYRLLASIVERKDFTEDDQKQYFEVVKKLHDHSEPFYYVNDSICFTPRYELDMFVLGIPYTNENSDKYASLNYQFTYENATFEELQKGAKELTEPTIKHPTE